MSIRRYKDEDYYLLECWCKDRGAVPPPKQCLSTLGFVSDERAIGFLYITDSNIAFIEYVISDPLTVPSMRRQSVKKLCGNLIDTAFLLGYTHVFALTEHPQIKKLCEEFGFKSKPSYELFVLAESETK